VKVLLIILLIILGLIAWILLAPIIIKIDSHGKVFEIRVVSIGRIRLLLEQELLKFKFHLFFFRRQYEINLLEKIFGEKKEASKEKRVEKKKEKEEKTDNWDQLKRIKNVLQSFNIQVIRLNIDTHNYYINAFLYPVFAMLNAPKINMTSNFIGHNELLIITKNRLYRMLIAYYSKS